MKIFRHVTKFILLLLRINQGYNIIIILLLKMYTDSKELIISIHLGSLFIFHHMHTISLHVLYT